MRINRPQFNERIRTINTEFIGAFDSFEAANVKASAYFHETLELECTDDECEEGCYYWSSSDGGGDTGIFDESVFVHKISCKS